MDIVPSDSPQGKPHYTYALYYPDDYSNEAKAGTAFYIGKGQGNRINEHEQEVRAHRVAHNPHKANTIRKIWREGKEVKKEKLASFATHEEALLHEIALIFFLPNLTNRTRGGDGIVGLPRTAEHQRKIADSRRGHKASEETRRRLSESHKSNPRPDLIAKMVKAREGKPNWAKGKKRSEEEIRKMSEYRKGRKTRPCPEETRRKISEAHKRRYKENPRPPVSEETKQKLSTAFKGRVFTPEWRQKISEANKGKGAGIKQSPEIIAKRVASIKKTREEKAKAKQAAQTFARGDQRQYQQLLLDFEDTALSS